jgi:hypothetical protein
LVGQSQGHDPVTLGADVLGDLAQGGYGQVGDLGGVVLDLAGMGEELGQLAVGGPYDLPPGIERNCTDPGSPGV